VARLGTPRAFVTVIVAGWALYLSIVWLTNALDGLKHLDVLGSGWEFASGNYPFLRRTTDVYSTPAAIDIVLFCGVVVWEALAAGLWWRAIGDRTHVYAAATVTLALWVAFIVADEIFLAYDVEETHWRLFIALVASVLAVRVLTPQDE
jgi:hypothetical protein